MRTSILLAVITSSLFLSLISPAQGSDCVSDPYAGPCTSYTTRYAYVKKFKRCVAFTYGGCGGNGNNYKTLLACVRACTIPSVPEASEKIIKFP